MRFFFDRSVPLLIARMVRGVEGGLYEIRHLDEDERFVQTAPDSEWMRAIKKDGEPLWVIISGDGRILKDKNEKKVLVEVRLPFFCMDKPWPNTPKYEYAWKFMKVWPNIIEQAKEGEGKIFRVSGGAALNLEQLP